MKKNEPQWSGSDVDDCEAIARGLLPEGIINLSRAGLKTARDSKCLRS